MKKVLSLAASIVMLAFTSWTPLQTNQNTKTLTLKTSVVQPPADAWNFHTTYDLNEQWYNECTGEWMQVNVTLVWINTGQLNGNRYTSVWNVRVNGTAVGLTSGTEYLIRENNNSTFTQSFINGQLAFPLKDKWRFISKGNAANLSGEFSWDLVYNAKGEEIVNTFNYEINCQ